MKCQTTLLLFCVGVLFLTETAWGALTMWTLENQYVQDVEFECGAFGASDVGRLSNSKGTLNKLPKRTLRIGYDIQKKGLRLLTCRFHVVGDEGHSGSITMYQKGKPIGATNWIIRCDSDCGVFQGNDKRSPW